jgi:hypothetical protein
MGTGFLMGINIFHGYGFGIAKPDGFVPVAISNGDPAGSHEGLFVSVGLHLESFQLLKVYIN